MNFNEIKELIQIINNSELRTFEINFEGVNINMSKNESAAFKHIEKTAPVAQNVNVVAAETSAPAVTEVAKAVDMTSGNIIKSPIVGTFYSSSKPSSPALKSKGDKVKKGEVVCIVEAMKIMNEITSEFDGVVEEIFAENEQLVEFGQPLFKIV